MAVRRMQLHCGISGRLAKVSRDATPQLHSCRCRSGILLLLRQHPAGEGAGGEDSHFGYPKKIDLPNNNLLKNPNSLQNVAITADAILSYWLYGLLQPKTVDHITDSHCTILNVPMHS